MSFEAEFSHGDPLMIDHTPAADVEAGQVVVIGDLPTVAHRAIAADSLGAVAARGGVYRLPKAAGGSTAIGDRKKVYWDDANNVITTTASGNKVFGYTVGASVDADTSQLVEHCPTA